MPTSEAKRKTHTKSGVALRTFYVCDPDGQTLEKFHAHEARNAAPSAAARKLAKHVLPKGSRKASVLHIRARGPTGKYATGAPRIFAYNVKRSMAPVSAYIIENSQKEGYANPRTKKPYEEGDTIPQIVAKSANVGLRGGAKRPPAAPKRAPARKRLRGGGGGDTKISELLAENDEAGWTTKVSADAYDLLQKTMIPTGGDCGPCKACDVSDNKIKKFLRMFIGDLLEMKGSKVTQDTLLSDAYAAGITTIEEIGVGAVVDGREYTYTVSDDTIQTSDWTKANNANTPLQAVYVAANAAE